MTIQFSDTLRNARADVIETHIGASPKVQIRTGAQPANCAAADSGTLLVEFTLDATWADDASGGSKAFSDVPVSQAAVAAGTAAHFRVKSSGGTTHWQGSVTATGGGGDLTIDNTSIANGQTVQITGWTVTEGNA